MAQQQGNKYYFSPASIEQISFERMLRENNIEFSSSEIYGFETIIEYQVKFIDNNKANLIHQEIISKKKYSINEIAFIILLLLILIIFLLFQIPDIIEHIRKFN